MKKTWIWVLVIVGILVAIRIAMPYILKNYINKTLQEMEGYNGSVEDIDLNLFRGAYVINDLVLTDESNEIPVPFVSIQNIDLSVEWSALIKGKIAGEIILDQPVVNFAVKEDESQDGTDTNWQEMIKELMPITINRFEIKDGAISYYDFNMDPELEIYIENLDLVMTNLSNVENENEELPSALTATGYTLGGGNLNLDAKFNMLKEVPDMDMTMNIEQVDMTALNEFIRAYTNTDVEKGTFNLYSEIVVDDAQLQGYVKPVLENLEILDWDEEEGGFLKKTWEAMVAGVKEIFENNKEDQVATQTPLEGNLNQMNLDAGIWPTIWGLFRNAFVEALSKQTENAIDFPLEE
jgi:uncharacterized protein involved in outer membrane biogenesis